MKKEPVIIEGFRESRPYVIWRRVSTKRQGESGLGLEAQVEICKYCMRKDPVAIYTDVRSGTKLAGCVELWKAVDYCKQHDYVLVIAKTDRWRNAEEALGLLDKIGVGNLFFCDLPECNRFVLTILCALHERTAFLTQFNTGRAMGVIKSIIDKDGCYVAKSGRVITHLGRDKGSDMTPAVIAQAKKKADEAYEWRINNDGYKWVKGQVALNRTQKDMLREFNMFHDLGLKGFSTRNGCKMNPCTLSHYVNEIKERSK